LEIAKGIVIDDNEKLIINDFGYIKALANLISRTEPRVLANYLGWRAARAGELNHLVILCVQKLKN
jgi:hypothetical protein